MSTQLEIPTGTWTLDPVHSNVTFSVRHMMIAKVRGRFTSFGAEVVIAEEPQPSSVTASVEMTSVDTHDAGRDEHLRTNDFFDVENHPTMTFRSTSISGSGEDYELAGDLTLRGVTKPVVFDVEVGGTTIDPWGGTRAGFTASTNISRKEFGLEYNAALETGGVLIGDKVDIELDVELVRASDDAAPAHA